MWWVYALIAAFVLFLLFLISYVKVGPDKVCIISGPHKSRMVTGRATLRIPFIERIDILSLDLIQVDIQTESAVPTNEFINIFVDGVANIKIGSNDESIKKAAEIFLNRKHDDIRKIAKEVLEGNLREIVGQMKLKELVQNRDKFAEKVQSSAADDMKRMGLEIVNITIQNFRDENNVIQDLGVDNISQIRKDASIAKANSEKEVKIASSEADELANEARIKAELKIEEQNTELALKKAALKQQADIAKATADASYSIQEAEQSKLINVAKQDAQIANTVKQVELAARQAEVQEKALEARIKKQADAERYAAEQAANAELYKRTKEAEATLAEQKLAAEALKASAEAERFSAEQKAAGIAAVGAAEAEAIAKKADAMKKMENAAILQLVLDSKVLPEIVGAAAAPLAQTDHITMYGSDNSTKLVSDVMTSTSKILEGVKGSTGLDLASLLAGALGGKILAEKPVEKKEE